MTHFLTLVLVDKKDNIDETVERLLAPYDENNEWFKDGSRWDWWVIGGRFTGALTGYNPYTDPDNLHPCKWCEETGSITASIAEIYPAYAEHVGKKCFQCDGTGQQVRHRLKKYAGDTTLFAANIIARNIDPSPMAVVTPDGKWHEIARPLWWGMSEDSGKTTAEWLDEVDALLNKHPDHIVVVVDCHV